MDRNEQKDAYSSDPDITPAYIKPKMSMFRLEKIMDEYCGGVSAHFTINNSLLERCLDLLACSRETQKNRPPPMCTNCRAPGKTPTACGLPRATCATFCYVKRAVGPVTASVPTDPGMDEVNWKRFVNSVYDHKSGEWILKKVPVINVPI